MFFVPEVTARGELSYACACCGSCFWSIEKAKECWFSHEHYSHGEGCLFENATFVEMLTFKKKELEGERADHAKLLRKVIDTPDYVRRIRVELARFVQDKDRQDIAYENLRTTIDGVEEKLKELEDFVNKNEEVS